MTGGRRSLRTTRIPPPAFFTVAGAAVRGVSARQSIGSSMPPMAKAAKKHSKRSSYAISSHGRWRAAKDGKIRRIRAPKTAYARQGLLIPGEGNKRFVYHVLQGSAFPHLSHGALSAERNTWDHITNDRDDPRYMHATNLRPASRAEQALNKTTSENPVRGRPVGAGDDAWEPFDNPGRAASELQTRFPSKKWGAGGIRRICDGTKKTSHGWEFQWVDAASVVRNVQTQASEEPILPGEEWRALRMPDGAVDTDGRRVSSLGRYTNSYGTIYTPKPGRGRDYAAVGIAGKDYQFHNLVAATFVDVLGPRPSSRHTIDHIKSREPWNNAVSNLQWADKREQVLNQARNDNPVEGRAVDAPVDAPWQRFANSGAAARELKERFPETNWNCSSIRNVCDRRNGSTQHQGWTFRWPDGARPVRNASSAPSEPQWAEDGALAAEEWARIEPLGGACFEFTPELRGGGEGEGLTVDLREFACESSSDSDSDEDDSGPAGALAVDQQIRAAQLAVGAEEGAPTRPGSDINLGQEQLQ